MSGQRGWRGRGKVRGDEKNDEWTVKVDRERAGGKMG